MKKQIPIRRCNEWEIKRLLRENEINTWKKDLVMISEKWGKQNDVCIKLLSYMILWLITLLFWSTIWRAAQENEWRIDLMIVQACSEHPQAKDILFTDQISGRRCQAIMRLHRRFEDVRTHYNNVWGYMRDWRIMRFNTIRQWIEFWVSRYYKYERCKPIKAIMYWWGYEWCDWTRKIWIPYSYTDQNTYYWFMKNEFWDYYNLMK